MQDVILVGSGITAEIVFSYLKTDNRYTVVGCVVDDSFADKSNLAALPCVGMSEVAVRFPPSAVHAVMASGYGSVNATRQMLFDKIKLLGYQVVTYVHRRAAVFSDKPLGEGCLLMPGAQVEPEASIGCNCMLWCNTVVAHHAVIEDHCWLAAGAVVAGMAKVGRCSFIGVNATISNKVVVGERNIVGGAAFISKCTKDNAVYLARSGEPFRCTAEEYAKHFGV